jgi:molybdopterin-guanine dinucleotide biosynthesis protein A
MRGLRPCKDLRRLLPWVMPSAMESAFDYPDTIGVILAGGRSARMGGGDKGLRPVGGTSVLARIAARLAPQTKGLVISANGEQGRFEPFGLPVLPDGPGGAVGPLAGVLAALRHASGIGVPFVVSVPCDTPFLPVDLVARLHEARIGNGAPGAVASSRGREHPTVGLWPVSSLPDLEQAVLGEGMRRARDAVARLRLAPAEWTLAVDPFFNVNTPEELAVAEIIAAAEDKGA